MRPHTFFQSLFCLLLCAFMLLPAGCTNDDYDRITNEGNEDYMPVDITFGGIETLFGPYRDEARNVQYNKIHETQDFDSERMLETLVIAEPDTLQPPLTRATSAVTNTTLRIVAYDENNATYKGTGVYNISSTGAVTPKSGEELALKSGKYYFHCFSPAQAVSVSGNNVTVALPTGGSSSSDVGYFAKATHTSSFKTYSTKTNLSSTSTRTVSGHYFGTNAQRSVADQDKYVFLPAAGGRIGDATGSIDYEGSRGYYWGSMPNGSDTAYILYFDSSTVYVGTNHSYRYYGRPLRCVSYQ